MQTINLEKFIKVIASEGYVLTTDKEGEEIVNYFSEGAFPLSYNVNDLRAVPISEITEPTE